MVVVVELVELEVVVLSVVAEAAPACDTELLSTQLANQVELTEVVYVLALIIARVSSCSICNIRR